MRNVFVESIGVHSLKRRAACSGAVAATCNVLDSTGSYLQSGKTSLQRAFRPNGLALCQPGASPHEGNFVHNSNEPQCASTRFCSVLAVTGLMTQ